MGQKHKPFREFRTPFPLRDIRENPRSNVRACAAGDGAICSKNRKIVPYHGANPNTEMARAYGLPPRLWLLVLSIMPNSPVRDQWEYLRKMERHFPIKLGQPIETVLVISNSSSGFPN